MIYNVKFKNMISNNYKDSNSYANRGMTLEEDINLSNEYYKNNNICLVYKKPTPIKVVKVEYPKNKISEAYFDKPSTLDYTGIYKNTYLEFDAKECQSKSSFPISNIHNHQLEHIRGVLHYGGLAYLIVRFTTINETYVLLGSDLINFIDNNTRKSIPMEYFHSKGYLIPFKYMPRVDYIKVIDKILMKEVD